MTGKEKRKVEKHRALLRSREHWGRGTLRKEGSNERTTGDLEIAGDCYLKRDSL